MKCFVIMPFGDANRSPALARQFEHLFTEWIKPAVEKLEIGGSRVDITCHRADKEVRPGEIVAQVIEAVSEADVVVADLTGRNANVFYELGVRHSLRNNTILISQDADDIPFDLRGMRAICYKYEPESLVALRNKLQASLAETLTSTDVIDNPVRRFLYDREVAKLVTAPVPPGFDALRQVVAEMEAVRKDLAERVGELRGLVEHTTAKPQPVEGSDDGLSIFEGTWTSVEHGGLYIVGRVGSELRGPYCFGSDHKLTSHFFNVQSVGGQFLARFRWFDDSIEGCITLRPVTRDTLSGGWWYLHDLPANARRDLLGVRDDLPAMNKLTLVRIPAPRPLPGWVTEYFERAHRDHAYGMS